MSPAAVLAQALPDHTRACTDCGEAYIRDQVQQHRWYAHTSRRWSAAREVL